jgi:ATP-dependent RNA helicase RhlE
VVLDEADRMLDMGFLPDVRRILAMLREDRQTMLFSATLEGEIAKLAEGSTRNAVLHKIKEERPTVSEATHRFIGVAHTDKHSTLVRELAADRGLTLIFTRTKRGADKLARNLKRDGFRAGALHGDMNQGQRERALGHFAAGRSDVLVATDVAARGLDLEHISHVINFDPPGDDKTYVHRVGRTARAGRSGTGITFVTPEQTRDVAMMAKALKLDTEFAHAGLAPRPVPARPNTRDRNRSRNRQRSRG